MKTSIGIDSSCLNTAGAPTHVVGINLLIFMYVLYTVVNELYTAVCTYVYHTAIYVYHTAIYVYYTAIYVYHTAIYVFYTAIYVPLYMYTNFYSPLGKV